ncbi:MAG TPA: hypothetical protein VEM58_00100 [Streptosporangiaceae bacterium]|nr:hypothetical protein [Streptosporangiaceae bacterium]
MRQSGSSGQAGRPAGARASRAMALGTLAVLGMTVAAGCSTGHAGPGAAASSAARTYVTSCGPARTSADVPVTVEVASGHISCGTAKAVELAYAKAIRSGLEPGNGGGGPVKIMRWTCQGFATPVVLHTGKASKCTRGRDEILEILLPPSPAPSPSAS